MTCRLTLNRLQNDDGRTLNTIKPNQQKFHVREIVGLNRPVYYGYDNLTGRLEQWPTSATYKSFDFIGKDKPLKGMSYVLSVIHNLFKFFHISVF